MAHLTSTYHDGMQIFTDKDYRSHVVPCYPLDENVRKWFIRRLEAQIVVEICDKDYGLPLNTWDSFDDQQAA